MSNKVEQLAKASKDLMLSEPFYGMFLIMLNKRWDDNIPTAGVCLNGINYQLLISEKYWSTLSESHHIGLLKHELLHIGFFHLTDYASLTDRDVANIAMDLEINQYIASHLLPPGGMVLSMFPELNLEPKKGTHYYYEKLQQGKKDGNCPNLNKMLEGMGQGQMTISIDVKGKPSSAQMPDHSTWKDMENLSEAEQKLIQKQVEHILKEVAEQAQKACGNVPGEFSEILDRINHREAPKFDWRGYLRRFTGGSTKIFTKKTRRKYNKRYDENSGLKIKPKRHILVAIDTSGSVSSNELKEFLGEMHHIQKTGTEITVVQADTAISHIEKFNHRKEFQVFGRGGTTFQPVVDYYNSNLHKYTCMFYFTDGEASAPTKAKGRMLWVLSSKSNINPDLIGPQIKLN